jgi:hypothetical protein
MLLILIAGGSWVAAAALLGVTIGRGIRLRDRREQVTR